VPFGGPQGDGDPAFHQRFYQAVAISIPLVILRLPPVKRWITTTRAAGQAGPGFLSPRRYPSLSGTDPAA
jgi:hypothetical protein